MEMPKPRAEHARLAALAGRWSGPELVHPTPWAPEPRRATGHFANRLGVDGFYLINDYEQERDGAIVFRGHGVYGYDVPRARYTMFWFDTMGQTPREVLGSWDGDRLTFAQQGAQGHGRYRYELVAADCFRFAIELSTDGETWTTAMSGEYHRVGAAGTGP